MPQRKHKPEEIVAKLRQVDVLVSQGAVACPHLVARIELGLRLEPGQPTRLHVRALLLGGMRRLF